MTAFELRGDFQCTVTSLSGNGRMKSVAGPLAQHIAALITIPLACPRDTRTSDGLQSLVSSVAGTRARHRRITGNACPIPPAGHNSASGRRADLRIGALHRDLPEWNSLFWDLTGIRQSWLKKMPRILVVLRARFLHFYCSKGRRNKAARFARGLGPNTLRTI